MSDTVDPTPSQDGDGADRPPPPLAAAIGSGPLNLNPTAIQGWINDRCERFFGWLDAILSRTSEGRESWVVPSILPVADRLVSIVAGLIATIMVDRYYGPAGLGIFAWYFSLLAIVGYLGRSLPIDLRPFGIVWPGGAAALYLTYVPLAHFRVGVGATLLPAPILFAGLLWTSGVFMYANEDLAATVPQR